MPATVVLRQPEQLQRFVGNPHQNMPDGLPFRLIDYLELVEWTGKQIREDKRDVIDSDLPGILKRLDIDGERWLYMTQNFESSFKAFVGAVDSLRKACREMGYQRMPGRASWEALF